MRRRTYLRERLAEVSHQPIEYLEQLGNVDQRGDWLWVYDVDRERWVSVHVTRVSHVVCQDGPPKMGRPKKRGAKENDNARVQETTQGAEPAPRGARQASGRVQALGAAVHKPSDPKGGA